jgi:hypothetical protein
MVDVSTIKQFMDSEGRLKQWPAKRTYQLLFLDYLAEKIELGKEYTELEINSIVAQWHTYKDNAGLRRGLIDAKHLNRTPDGKKYWRVEKSES